MSRLVESLVASIRELLDIATATNHALRAALGAPDDAECASSGAPRSIAGTVARARRVSVHNAYLIEQLARVTVCDESRSHWMHASLTADVRLHWCAKCNQQLCASCASICSVVHDANLPFLAERVGE